MQSVQTQCLCQKRHHSSQKDVFNFLQLSQTVARIETAASLDQPLMKTFKKALSSGNWWFATTRALSPPSCEMAAQEPWCSEIAHSYLTSPVPHIASSEKHPPKFNCHVKPTILNSGHEGCCSAGGLRINFGHPGNVHLFQQAQSNVLPWAEVYGTGIPQ